MDDPARSPDTVDPRPRPEGASPSGPSRWLAVVVIILVIGLLGLIVFLHVSGAIGPGVH